MVAGWTAPSNWHVETALSKVPSSTLSSDNCVLHVKTMFTFLDDFEGLEFALHPSQTIPRCCLSSI